MAAMGFLVFSKDFKSEIEGAKRVGTKQTTHILGPMLSTVDPIAAAEIAHLAEMIEKRKRGEVSEEDFVHLRVKQSVYGLRGQTDMQMVRVKVQYRALKDTQLDRGYS